MSDIKLQDYIKNPCKYSSLPYWKIKTISVPDELLILHDEQFQAGRFDAYLDEQFFRLKHELNNLRRPSLPQGFSLKSATVKEYADHINDCYSDLSVSEELLRGYTERSVYSKNLWIAVIDADKSSSIVASGIAEFDPVACEGALEWIQVTKEYRGKGLGQFVVNELLWRLNKRADFVTVSGKVDNATKPEKLYRKCGFVGSDIWHILRHK